MARVRAAAFLSCAMVKGCAMKRLSTPTAKLTLVLSLVLAAPVLPPRSTFAADPNHIARLHERKECQGCDLTKADLFGTDLSGTDLSGADLFGANLSKTDLDGSNLSGANLMIANLSGASINRANLSG